MTRMFFWLFGFFFFLSFLFLLYWQNLLLFLCPTTTTTYYLFFFFCSNQPISVQYFVYKLYWWVLILIQMLELPASFIMSFAWNFEVVKEIVFIVAKAPKVLEIKTPKKKKISAMPTKRNDIIM